MKCHNLVKWRLSRNNDSVSVFVLKRRKQVRIKFGRIEWEIKRERARDSNLSMGEWDVFCRFQNKEKEIGGEKELQTTRGGGATLQHTFWEGNNIYNSN